VIQVISIQRLDSWDELDHAMRSFNVSSCVVDAMPELHEAERWVKRWGTRAWRCLYGNGKTEQPKWDNEKQTVAIDRTSSLDRTSEEFLSGTFSLPRFDGSIGWTAFIQHCVNSHRIPIYVEGTENSQSPVVHHWEWREVGADHLFHALNYAMIARLAPRGLEMPKVGLYTTSRAENFERLRTLSQEGIELNQPTRHLLGGRVRMG
jgi:hypothetical protein